MIKKLLLIILLAFPLMIYAEEKCDQSSLRVDYIDLLEKTNGVTEKSSPTINNGIVTINVKMSNVNDYISYKVKITNTSSKEIEIENVNFAYSNYFSYYLVPTDDGNDTSIDPGQSREALLRIKYTNEVPNNMISSDGTFIETKEVGFDLIGEGEELTQNDINSNNSGIGYNSDDTNNNQSSSSDTEITNPDTGDKGILLFIIVLLFIFGLVYLITRENKSIKYMVILFAILLPIYINGMCRYDFKLVTNIEIERCNYKLITNMGSFSSTENITEICVNDLHVGEDRFVSELLWNGNTPGTPAKMYFGLYQSIKGWTNSSYIRVYDNSSKSNLLLELRKQDAFNYSYSLGSISINPIFRNTGKVPYYLLGDYSEQALNDLYVDASSELFYNGSPYSTGCNPNGCIRLSGMIPYSIGFQDYRTIVQTREVLSPYTSSDDVVDYVDALKTSVGNLPSANGYNTLNGFTNCHIYETGRENVCEGNNYYAIIEHHNNVSY